jgi:hypothetical protein
VGPYTCPQKVLPVETIKTNGVLSTYLHGLIGQIFIGYAPGTKQGCGDKKMQKPQFLSLIKFPAE